jgi:hypothetical protein
VTFGERQSFNSTTAEDWELYLHTFCNAKIAEIVGCTVRQVSAKRKELKIEH